MAGWSPPGPGRPGRPARGASAPRADARIGDHASPDRSAAGRGRSDCRARHEARSTILDRPGSQALVELNQGGLERRVGRYLDTIGILGALEHVLARVTDKSVEYGAAVRAAQQVYARTVSEKKELANA